MLAYRRTFYEQGDAISLALGLGRVIMLLGRSEKGVIPILLWTVILLNHGKR